MISNYSTASFWLSQLDPQGARDPLDGDRDVDVVIVGAGYTGLWTAYYLKKNAPELNVAVVEANIAGYGASGRNGGWVVGYVAGLEKYVSSLPSAEKRDICNVLFDNVDAIGDVLRDEGIEANFHKGGVIYGAARFPGQVARQKAFLDGLYEAGHTEEDCWWLSADEMSAKVRLRNGYGGVFKKHAAVVHPAKMVRGLADAVEKLGVAIYEQTPAISVKPGEVVTKNGVVRAPVVVPALEGYSTTVTGLGTRIIPVQSLIIATEPLSESLWDEIGLKNREAFCDGGRMISYGQRSADDRMIFGARGGYVYGAKPRSEFSLSDPEFRPREGLMHDLFPMLKGVEVTHGWGGSLGVPRAFAPHAVFDKRSGLATAGGYVGQGVGPSHLFGRTLADLILERDSEFTRMPWVFGDRPIGRALRRWEPEPFRWLTSRLILSMYEWEEKLCQENASASWGKVIANAINNNLGKLMR
ncbi:NAD(P)/FAD-dependent oxidoreductase [Marinobacter bohaiensis]|uniref:NAD(P)/FAD-dependent oxidoreductase n=1 Tax=Marinobacter bohaiensis TaxID=2201898 RepID=UPI0013A6A854|nr:FAD-binding oxidoreductase [Marinobacter bohaiensis]